MSQSILILSGAGLSADSGVDTFRDEGGIWSKYNLEDVATPEGFARNPALVHEFYNARRCALPTVDPNPAHHALARLQKEMQLRGGIVHLVTQNVDNLLERAGVEKVIHMHGELAKIQCQHCNHQTSWQDDLSSDIPCPSCNQTGGLRPAVVWFGEMPIHMEEIEAALAQSDLFVSIGTSGSVYPAAGFVAAASQMGIATVELNLEPSDNHHLFTQTRYGPAKDIVPEWVDEVLEYGA